ncbi:protein arginine kinase [Desulfitobacterium metallireducens]|uniref:Protein-arginine kinase n=1 Tax=Desulfitobacterium metallireducens DSM 15288 TaxID=871968 RepID=W0E4S8_9FIRM|nr:protein arginine kinase [Desulfitobacterium metallireducens]AHF05865.1 ATP:guanido phosphotransferase [Desulfitobacterium metallireducens DSM 15288]
MQRKELLLGQSEWMKESSKSDVVLSSRVRLARNLENTPFPHILSPEQSHEVEEKIAKVIKDIKVEGKQLTYFSLPDLSLIEQQVLIEKHLISPGLVQSKGSRGVAVTEDHCISVMVNEEDHIRIQSLLPGNQLRECYRLANLMDDSLEEQLDIAYQEAQGYLTACPTNVGTGMRASAMVHLPALVMTKQVQQILGSLTNLGLAVRGLYGEGSQAYGHLFQVSNQITLGQSEEDILTHLEAVTGQIVEHELHAREALQRGAKLVVEDQVWRARGTLENARLLTSEDAMHLLSLDRMGVDMGLLPRMEKSFPTLLVDSLPGNLQYLQDRELDPGQRDEERARLIRDVLRDQNLSDKKESE